LPVILRAKYSFDFHFEWIYYMVLHLRDLVRFLGFEDIREFETDFSQGILKVRIMELENGVLILLSDSNQYRLGQSAVAIPAGHGRTQPTSTGLFSTGVDSTNVRTLSERVSAITNQTSMVVSGLKEMTQPILMEIMLILKNHLVA
jgi:hypothetical protein